MAACVLVVDDSPTIARIVESVLSGAGYRVITARSGADGLVRARQDQPDLILLDQVMPRMTGYQFCQQLAADDVAARIPVVMMTSKGEPGNDRFASGFNVVDYVTKPFSPEVILALTSHTLEKVKRTTPPSGDTIRLSSAVHVAVRPPPSFDPEQPADSPPVPDAEAAAETSATPAAETIATPAAETSATPAAETIATPAAETIATPAAETIATPAAETIATPAAETADAAPPGDEATATAGAGQGSAADTLAPATDEDEEEITLISGSPLGQAGSPSGANSAAETLPGPADGLVLWADLHRVPLPEIMQLIELQAHTGCFKVTVPGTRYDIYLQRGRVRAVRAEGTNRELRLGRFLVARGLLAASELEQLASSASGRGGLPLGEKLIRLGHIRADQLRDALAEQCCELVYEVLRARGGHCSLHAGTMPPPEFDSMLVDLDIQSLLMEGLRRVDEWGVIEREVPSFDAVFVHRASSLKDPGEFTSDERRLLMLVDGRRDVHALIGAARMRPFEACKLLYRLAATRQIAMVESSP